MMKLLLTLNEGVRSLGNRFDTYQKSIDAKLDKVNAEFVLLKNRVEILEASNRQQQLRDEGVKVQ